MAFGKTPRPVFKESSVASFPNSGLPSIKYNYAFCKVGVASLQKSNNVVCFWMSVALIEKKLNQVSTIVIHSCIFLNSSSHFSFSFFTSDLFTNLPLSDELIGYKIRANHELSSTLDFSQDVVWTFYKLLRVFHWTRSCSVFATSNEALL